MDTTILKEVTIKRYYSGRDGVFGIVLVDHAPFCLSLEDPDNDNKKNISCIPAAEYSCEPVHSPRFGKTWEIKNVPNRSAILFHAGNTIQDTQGCILLGHQIAKVAGILGIIHSQIAFSDFKKKLNHMPFLLRIFDL